MVSFAEPARLWLLVVPAVMALLAGFRHRQRLALQKRLASPGVWLRLLGGTPATGLLRLFSWSMAAALIVVALARPQWGELPGEESVRTRDLVVALDVSDSMLCPDVRPTRLAHSIEALTHLLPQLEGNRMAVVVFAGEAYPLVPLTTDLSAVAVFLEGVAPGMVALPGSNLEVAVATALELLPEEGEGRVLLLFTDGENLQGDVSAATTALQKADVGVLGVVAGSERGGPIPEVDDNGDVRYKRDGNGQPVVTRAHPEVLAQIADAVGGEVVNLEDPDAVHQIAQAVHRLQTREVETTTTRRRIERFPLFLAAAAVLLAVGFALSPWRRTVAALSLMVLITVSQVGEAQDASQAASAPPAQAPSALPAGEGAALLPPAPWWQRLIPGGSRRLARSGLARWQANEVDKAAANFAGALDLDPRRPERLYDLGTALAAEGQLAAATPLLEQADQAGVPGAAYNSGTAALEHVQAEAAVNWLRRAMLANPDDVAAKHNYELALRMLEEQQKQQNQQQNQQQDQQDQQEKQDQQDQQDEDRQSQQQQQPTPTPSAQQGAAPTPAPDPNQPLYAALQRAEAEGREAMRSPTPRAVKVEKDW